MKKLILIMQVTAILVSACGKKKYDCTCYLKKDDSFVSIEETGLFGCAEFPNDSTYCSVELARL